MLIASNKQWSNIVLIIERVMFPRPSTSRSGQAMIEFLVVAGILMAVGAILAVFLSTFSEYGTRVLDLVGSEYP
jgi:hypothetical protein